MKLVVHVENLGQTSMNAKPEKRKYFRHPIQVPIKLRELAEQELPPSKFQSEDLNDHGLCFYSGQGLASGTALRLAIPVEEHIFEVSARVAYSRKDSKTGTFRTGVYFEDMDSAFRAKIAEEILKIQEYRKKLSRTLGYEVSEADAARKWIEQFAKHFSAFF
jgi:c-di-GMP-binding flagellar brake protein YcgR